MILSGDFLGLSSVFLLLERPEEKNELGIVEALYFFFGVPDSRKTLESPRKSLETLRKSLKSL